MLFAVDIGNTQTAYGLFFKGELDGHWRVTTRPEETADEIAIQAEGLLGFAGHRLAEVTAVCVASVVPAATAAFVKMCVDFIGVAPLVVDSYTKTGLKIDYDPPRAVGADRLANAVGGVSLFDGPLLIVDFGTATTFDVLLDGGVYIGGAIAPGLSTAAEALFKSAARLSGVALEAPSSRVGGTTEDSLKSGLVYGTASMVDGMVRSIKAERETDFKVLATGGLVDIVAPHCREIDEVEPLLTLTGLKNIWEMNT